MTHREFPVPGLADDPQRPLVINYRAPYQPPSTDLTDDVITDNDVIGPVSDVNMYFGFKHFEPRQVNFKSSLL